MTNGGGNNKPAGATPSRTVPSIPGILAPPNVAEQLQRTVQQLLHRRSHAFPGAQPVSFARKHLEQNLMTEDYYACEKSDGIRCLMFLSVDTDDNEATYLITRTNEYYFVEGLHFPTNGGPATFHKDCIIDGELVISKEGGEERLQYLMFDFLVFEGKPLVERDLDKRLGYLEEYIAKPLRHLAQQFPQDVAKFVLTAKMKRMITADRVESIITQLANFSHVSDGVIFTPKTTPYVFGTDPKLLKWKPPEENTVDLKLEMEFSMFTDEDLPEDEATYPDYDSKPHCKLMVWHGGNKHDYYDDLHLEDDEWEKLKALAEPLQGRILECNKDDESRWRYMRFRDDKPTANHISTVERVLESINDRVGSDELIKIAPQVRARRKEREAQALAARKRSRASVSEGHIDKRTRNE